MKLDRSQALSQASMMLCRLARANGYYTDQMAWDALAGLVTRISRADVNSVKRQARIELDAQGEHYIKEHN